MEFDSLIKQVTINPDVLQVKEDYMYLYRSLEAEGLSQNTGDGFNMAFVLLDRAYQIMALRPIPQVATGEVKEEQEEEEVEEDEDEDEDDNEDEDEQEEKEEEHE